MKRLTLSAVAALGALSLISGMAMAKPSGDRAPVSFEELDANADGLITQEEMTARRMARVFEADANGDGALSVEEMQNHAMARMKDRAEKMMTRLDANEDGLLSADELSGGERSDKRFKRADRNGDGSIDKEEYERVAEGMGKRRHKQD